MERYVLFATISSVGLALYNWYRFRQHINTQLLYNQYLHNEVKRLHEKYESVPTRIDTLSTHLRQHAQVIRDLHDKEISREQQDRKIMTELETQDRHITQLAHAIHKLSEEQNQLNEQLEKEKPNDDMAQLITAIRELKSS